MEWTAVVKRTDEWWIGWMEEVPGVNCQERTREELLRSLGEALSEALAFNRREALEAAVQRRVDAKRLVAVSLWTDQRRELRNEAQAA